MSLSCAFRPCAEVLRCAFDRGCVAKRFHVERAPELVERDRSLRADAKALNGTKARMVRDPRFIKRKRKALTP
jgi:hypothetical protein